MIDFEDIKVWNKKGHKFNGYLSSLKNKESIDNSVRISPLKVDAIKIYCLFKTFISNSPNGFYTYIQKGLPLDNMIYWDFVLECEKGFIHVWRTPFILEAIYDVDIPNFQLETFLENNINKYQAKIYQMRQEFDNHTTYINHYVSYRMCVEYLWNELSQINLEFPESKESHLLENQNESNILQDTISQFNKASIKFHSLGKSLILNAAFMTESFVNLFIRIGIKKEIKSNSLEIKNYIKLPFKDKLKYLKDYTQIMNSTIDIDSKEIQNIFKLMDMRNKYVHFDETSLHNKIGTIYFDNDYPIYPSSSETPLIEGIKLSYHIPNFDQIKNSYEAANQFISYIESLIIEDYRESILFFMKQNPIGYNEKRKQYSVVYNYEPMMFYMIEKNDSK